MTSTPEIDIDTLNLQLPPALRWRAEAIARLTARELSRIPLSHSVELTSMTVPPVKITGGETDRIIARRISGAIHRQILSLAQQGADHD